MALVRCVRCLVFLSALLVPPAVGAAEPAARNLAGSIAATHDTDALYALALDALAADQPALALDALERVVGARPRFAGAWLDLALAAYRSGDPAAALEHLEYLRGQFSLPPALASQVDYWRRLWQTPGKNVASRGWQGEILFGFGRDSNANAGLASQQISLSLPGGSALFSIDNSYLPRADQFGLFGVTAWGPAHAFAYGRINPVVLLRSKQLVQEHDFDTFDLQPGLIYEQAVSAEGSWQASAFAQHYRLGGHTLFNGLRFGAQRIEQWQTCRWNGGGEIERRQHQRVANLGGTLFSLSGGLGCRLHSEGTVSATLKAGYEQAPGDRPGGDNRSGELQLVYDQPFNDSQRLQASWQYTRISDLLGYSPLLENNAPRQLRRQSAVLSLRQAIAREWEARLNYEHFQQRANLALFEQRGNLLMLGLVYRFD